ncbi:hypothetical protein EAF07_00005 [Streptococcus hillyeri]|uniref:Uncharacterized protein n=1 Tax=Streptococcus hillyeri TaxID=2282420 RepID=A0A3L9DYR9_9STRE|nr:hypothetical protein EAF07_00005 [Streptococcus hillyeri]
MLEICIYTTNNEKTKNINWNKNVDLCLVTKGIYITLKGRSNMKKMQVGATKKALPKKCFIEIIF